MPETKYFDYKNNLPIDLELDGCDLTDWKRRYAESSFAKHPKGFKIFISPDRLSASDEYAGSDPYNLEQGLENAFNRRRVDLTINLLKKAVSSVQGAPKILDLGCGQGHITQAMRQKISTAEFTALDYSVSAIEYAHDHFPGIDFCVANAYAAPYAKGYFDVVVCNNLWEHVPDPLYLLGGIKDLLKPGGYTIVSTPSRYRLANLINILKGKPVEFMSKQHVTEYSVGQVIEQLTYGGFHIEKIISRPISLKKFKDRIRRTLVSAWVSFVGSHHQLEATVFYLAKKYAGGTEPTAVRKE
jgi:2-polyprenyl-3-methyl-5-hydroxy-6-metoxy-1,4-benzoquinol methylase